MFDEPTNGLDPDGIVWIRGLMRSLAAQGRVVLVSSHLMSELQDTADQLVVIGRGRLVAETTVADLLASVSKDQVEVVTDQRSEAMTVLANAGATVTVQGADGVVVEGLPGDAIASLLACRRRPVRRAAPPPGLARGGVHGAHPRRGRVRDVDEDGR